jgi:hypothetical protein
LRKTSRGVSERAENGRRELQAQLSRNHGYI